MNSDDDFSRKTPENTGKSPQDICILVLDSDPTCLTTISRMLQKSGYRVMTAERATDALHILKDKDGEIDLIMTEVHLADMDKYELLESITGISKLPIVVMAANWQANSVLGCLYKGARHYLMKPFGMDDLKNIWQTTVNGRPGILSELDPVDMARNEWVEEIEQRKEQDDDNCVLGIQENQKLICEDELQNARGHIEDAKGKEMVEIMHHKEDNDDNGVLGNQKQQNLICEDELQNVRGHTEDSKRMELLEIEHNDDNCELGNQKKPNLDFADELQIGSLEGVRDLVTEVNQGKKRKERAEACVEKPKEAFPVNLQHPSKEETKILLHENELNLGSNMVKERMEMETYEEAGDNFELGIQKQLKLIHPDDLENRSLNNIEDLGLDVSSVNLNLYRSCNEETQHLVHENELNLSSNMKKERVMIEIYEEAGDNFDMSINKQFKILHWYEPGNKSPKNAGDLGLDFKENEISNMEKERVEMKIYEEADDNFELGLERFIHPDDENIGNLRPNEAYMEEKLGLTEAKILLPHEQEEEEGIGNVEVGPMEALSPVESSSNDYMWRQCMSNRRVKDMQIPIKEAEEKEEMKESESSDFFFGNVLELAELLKDDDDDDNNNDIIIVEDNKKEEAKGNDDIIIVEEKKEEKGSDLLHNKSSHR